jgi:hypothetical protein
LTTYLILLPIAIDRLIARHLMRARTSKTLPPIALSYSDTPRPTRRSKPRSRAISRLSTKPYASTPTRFPPMRDTSKSYPICRVCKGIRRTWLRSTQLSRPGKNPGIYQS